MRVVASSSNQPGASQTGIVTVNRPLDRERIPEYRLTVSVKDNPENPRIARKVRLRETEGGCGVKDGEKEGREGRGRGRGESTVCKRVVRARGTSPLERGWQPARGLKAHICLSKRWLQV